MNFDVVVIGAGAAGMMCALQAATRGFKVAILEHNDKPGKKILISGGGRCNFTNIGTSSKNFASQNEHFCKSALSRYTPNEFIALVERHGIAYHEKKLGQLFCDRSAREIVQMLESECREKGADLKLACRVNGVEKTPDGRFLVLTSQGDIHARSVVVASGGLSIPQIGATDVGYKIARHFGLRVTSLVPALDGFTVDGDLAFLKDLAGVSLECVLSCANGISFKENILFTHKGLSGPVALQGSLYWQRGESIRLNMLPDSNVVEWLHQEKASGSRKQLKNFLAEKLPSRFSEAFCSHYHPEAGEMCQIPDRVLAELAKQISSFEIRPSGTVGYSKAEVTRGGVDTNELSSKTLEAKKVPGLYFIGEVVDVTGWLGGYNFQWAWASGWAAAQALE